MSKVSSLNLYLINPPVLFCASFVCKFAAVCLPFLLSQCVIVRMGMQHQSVKCHFPCMCACVYMCVRVAHVCVRWKTHVGPLFPPARQSEPCISRRPSAATQVRPASPIAAPPLTTNRPAPSRLPFRTFPSVVRWNSPALSRKQARSCG